MGRDLSSDPSRGDDVGMLLGVVDSHFDVENLKCLEFDMRCVLSVSAAGMGNAMQIVDRTTRGTNLQHLSLSMRLEQLACDTIRTTLEVAVCQTNLKRLTLRLLSDGLSVRDAMNDWDHRFIRWVLQNDCPHVILDWGSASWFFIVFLIKFFPSKLSVVVPRVERRIDFHLEWTGSFSFIHVIAMALERLDVAHKFVVVVVQRQQNADDPLKLSLLSDFAASHEKLTVDIHR
jgi:hypothetical protein